MDLSYGVFRRQPLDTYYLRKRLSRKPQTITAPVDVGVVRKGYLARTYIKSALTR